MQNSRTRRAIVATTGAVIVVVLLFATWSTNRAGGPQAGPIRTVTLRANDFFWSGVDLIDGSRGGAVQDREAKNAGKHIEFGNYFENEFTVGIQGGESGAILDLGHWEDLSDREGYQETVGGGQGFNSIHFRNGELVILDTRNPNTYRKFEQGDEFVNTQPTFSTSHAPARLGHIYLVRVLDDHDPSFEIIAKILVVGGSREGKEATILWEVLQRE